MLGPLVDPAGRIYVFGSTTSRDLPVTQDAIQTTYSGGASDGFLMILEPNGSPRFVTYLGGSGDELIRGIALGPAGEIYLVGGTTSDNFPVTQGALQTRRGGDDDGFIVKLVPR
jgi:Beta-propeller repeat.